MIEINLNKLERGTRTGMVTVKRGGKIFQRKQRLGQKETTAVSPQPETTTVLPQPDERLDEIINDLSKYSEEYAQENKPEMKGHCDKIKELVINGDIETAVDTFLSCDLKYDIGNVCEKLQKYKKDKYIESNFGSDWGTKPGEYTVYRSGSISDPKRGIFFSMDKKGAEAYSHGGEMSVNKYNIDIKNPFAVTEVKKAYSILANKDMSDILKQRDRAKNVGDWWRKLDAKVAVLAKKKGYDAITYTDPAAPAIRELVLLDKKCIIE